MLKILRKWQFCKSLNPQEGLKDNLLGYPSFYYQILMCFTL